MPLLSGFQRLTYMCHLLWKRERERKGNALRKEKVYKTYIRYICVSSRYRGKTYVSFTQLVFSTWG